MFKIQRISYIIILETNLYKPVLNSDLFPREGHLQLRLGNYEVPVREIGGRGFCSSRLNLVDNTKLSGRGGGHFHVPIAKGVMPLRPSWSTSVFITKI